MFVIAGFKTIQYRISMNVYDLFPHHIFKDYLEWFISYRH